MSNFSYKMQFGGKGAIVFVRRRTFEGKPTVKPTPDPAYAKLTDTLPQTYQALIRLVPDSIPFVNEVMHFIEDSALAFITGRANDRNAKSKERKKQKYNEFLALLKQAEALSETEEKYNIGGKYLTAKDRDVADYLSIKPPHQNHINALALKIFHESTQALLQTLPITEMKRGRPKGTVWKTRLKEKLVKDIACVFEKYERVPTKYKNGLFLKFIEQAFMAIGENMIEAWPYIRDRQKVK